MRGSTARQATFTAITPDREVRGTHPIRRIRALAEHLTKVTLLMALYPVRSGCQSCERLEYDLLLKSFLDLDMENPALDASTFSNNRGRRVEHVSRGSSCRRRWRKPSAGVPPASGAL